ncbi:MAG: hypothetical protein ABI220_04885 [Candidatus Saccharimonadales bacterium]
MSEIDKSHESLATSEQAQVVVDEVDRILKKVELIPGLYGVRNNSAPIKKRWHEGILLIFHPEGEGNVDDANSINMATVAWDNQDGSRTSYGTELTIDGLQLTKHIYPPAHDRTPVMPYRSMGSKIMDHYLTIATAAATERARAVHEQKTRIEERSLGLHLASSGEAAELLVKLQLVQPATGRAH